MAKTHEMHYINVIGRERPVATIHTVGSINIVVFFNEHGAPHFHAFGPDSSAKITIDDNATVMAGNLSRAHYRAVKRWAIANQDLLMKHWNEITLGT